jgi:hypothetical protein
MPDALRPVSATDPKTEAPAPPKAVNFKFYRIFCSTPRELEAERLAFESAVAQFVEQVSMPDAVLFAPASLRPPIIAANQKLTIESNIRMCEFFIQILGEQWPDPVFRGFVEYALDCVADPSLVTRNVCVFFRNYPAAAPELRQLREALAAAGRCELRDFSGVEELSGQFRELLSAWYAPLKPEPA